MKILFFGALILIVLLATFGSKLFEFKDIRQDTASVFKKQNHTYTAKDKDRLKGIPGKDSEIDKTLEEAREEQAVVMNPFVRKLLETEETELKSETISGLNKYLLILLVKIKKLNSLIVKVFFITASGIFLLMLFVRNNAFSGIGLLFAKLGFSLSRIIIFLIAVIAVVVWFILKYNFFVHIGSIFLCLLFLLVSSAVSLKIYDYNNPIWNRMIFSLIWPFVSGVIIHVS